MLRFAKFTDIDDLAIYIKIDTIVGIIEDGTNPPIKTQLEYKCGDYQHCGVTENIEQVCAIIRLASKEATFGKGIDEL